MATRSTPTAGRRFSSWARVRVVEHVGCREGSPEERAQAPERRTRCGVITFTCTAAPVALRWWRTCCGGHVVADMLWRTCCGGHVVARTRPTSPDCCRIANGEPDDGPAVKERR